MGTEDIASVTLSAFAPSPFQLKHFCRQRFAAQALIALDHISRILQPSASRTIEISNHPEAYMKNSINPRVSPAPNPQPNDLESGDCECSKFPVDSP
jgi:hypothetical protein